MSLHEIRPGSESTTTREKLQNINIGIYNETDRLKTAVVWGPVGAEAVLAQVYPKEISLFYDDMDVVEARQEANHFTNTLQGLGVNVISARDTFAQILSTTTQPLQKEQIVEAIIQRGKDIHKAHHGEEYKGGLLRLRRKIPTFAFEAPIRQLIDQDIELYGEQKALALNKALCLDAAYPLGDSIYARDQMNVLLGTRFISNMKYPIRKPEVALYEQVYDRILTENTQSVAIPDTETFEGGDAYVHNGIVYVGVGVRTTKGAAEFMYKTLQPQLDARGMKFAIVEDEHPETRNSKDSMDFMHLDTFSGPIGDKQIAVCSEEAERRRVKFLEMRDGQVTTVDTKRNFLEHLQDVDGEDNVVTISREEQQDFGCNFLAVDEKTILLPLDSTPSIIRKLKELRKDVRTLGLNAITRGYGASHCMTGQLQRAR